MPCASNSTRRARPLLGTFVEIAVGEPNSRGIEALIDAAFGEVERVHGLMSFHEPESDVSRLNLQAGYRGVEVHDWTIEVLAAACDLHTRSNGAFDITVAPVLQRLGRLPGMPREFSGREPSGLMSSTAKRGIELRPGNRVRFDGPEIVIDLGGIAKGYAVDRALNHLRRAGIASAQVNAGGDLATFGDAAAPVDIRDPRNPMCTLASIALQNGAVASSGCTYDPIETGQLSDCAVIDPACGSPVQTYAGASVCAETCMTADALTKVVMLSGRQSGEILEHYRASALLVAADGDICVTSNWPGVVPRAI